MQDTVAADTTDITRLEQFQTKYLEMNAAPKSADILEWWHACERALVSTSLHDVATVPWTPGSICRGGAPVLGLREAACEGQLGIARLLLHSGARCTMCSRQKNTPTTLFSCLAPNHPKGAEKNQATILRLLLKPEICPSPEHGSSECSNEYWRTCARSSARL